MALFLAAGRVTRPDGTSHVSSRTEAALECAARATGSVWPIAPGSPPPHPLGCWNALREVFPQTREQRCRLYEIANVLDGLSRSAHPGAKKAIAEIYNAEDRDHAHQAILAFDRLYGAKFPKAVGKVTGDQDVLLAFYDYPAEHWIQLRTTNPIESTFATLRPRTRVTKGAASRAAGLAMTFKLLEAAQARWRAVNAPHLVAPVRAGSRSEHGVLVERPQRAA